MTKLNKKSTEALQKPGLSAQEIVERETAVNEFPMKSRKYFGFMESSLIITIGCLYIKKNPPHKPILMVEFWDWETNEFAIKKHMELATLFIGPDDDILVESFFRKHLGDPNDEMEEYGFSTELFSPEKIIVSNEENPFKRGRHENGIRYLKPMIEKIKNLPDDCEDKALMKWFKFWSEKAVEKYGDDACIQFEDFPPEV